MTDEATNHENEATRDEENALRLPSQLHRQGPIESGQVGIDSRCGPEEEGREETEAAVKMDGHTMTPRILLACVVHESREIFQLALRSHAALKGISAAFYIDDGGESSDLLQAVACDATLPCPVEVYCSTVADSPIVGRHRWTRETMGRIGQLRNEALCYARDCNFDAVLFVDADLILHPNSALHLWASERPIISEVFWSQWNPGEPYLPQVWDFHNYGFHRPESILRLREPGVYEVGGLGACTMIRREALERGVDFSPVSNLGWPGEDRHFCTRASVLNVPLAADTSYPPFHVYRDSQIVEADKWFEELECDPNYFMETWLNDAWGYAVQNYAGNPKPSTADPVIVVCLPGEDFSRHVMCAWSALQPHILSKGFTVAPFFAHCSNVYVTRAMMAESIVKAGLNPKYILWIDDDQIATTQDFDRLLEGLEQNPTADLFAGWTWIQNDVSGECFVSAGIYTADGTTVKHIPNSEVARLAASDTPVVEVEWTGFPCVMMRYRALLKAGHTSQLRTGICNAFAPIPASKSPWGFSGEDIAFCVNAKDAGCKIFVDTRVFVNHLKLRAIGPPSPMAETQAANIKAHEFDAPNREVLEVALL